MDADPPAQRVKIACRMTLDLFDVAQMRAMSANFVKETNEFLQRHRVLCVSSERASERMWEDYADDHAGIVLRISPSVEKDSKLLRFRPVTYSKSRPPLYDQTLNSLKGHLFEDQGARARTILDKIIYAKTLHYKFENEYQLVIPCDDEGDWSAWSYHPEEISELYLGLAIDPADRTDFVAKAKAVNPQIAIFQADRDKGKKLIFRQF